MSNNPEYDEVSPVADEPIQSSARKSVPPLNGEAHVERAGGAEISKSKRIMRVTQSLTIIIALILSVYSFTVIDGINEATDDDEDANVILLRTEGRDADGESETETEKRLSLGLSKGKAGNFNSNFKLNWPRANSNRYTVSI